MPPDSAVGPAGATTKRALNWAAVGWTQLPLIVEGNAYYSYSFVADDPLPRGAVPPGLRAGMSLGRCSALAVPLRQCHGHAHRRALPWFRRVAQGGFVGGLLAAELSSAEVTLRRPVPVERRLHVESREGDVRELLDGDEVLARVSPIQLELHVRTLLRRSRRRGTPRQGPPSAPPGSATRSWRRDPL